MTVGKISAHSASVSWQEAKIAAEQWARDAEIPAALVGRMVILPVFVSDEDCAFFIPGRVSAFHRMMVQAISRTSRKAGAKVVPLTIRPKDYRAWLKAGSLEDTPDRRAQYFREQTRVV